jgi:hypothetical protein
MDQTDAEVVEDIEEDHKMEEQEEKTNVEETGDVDSNTESHDHMVRR